MKTELKVWYVLFFFSESLSVTLPNMVTAEVPAPIGMTTISEEIVCPLVLMEGVAKGGYPVDITSPSTVDLTSLDQPEFICASTLIEAGLEPAAAAQFEACYPVSNAEGPYSRETEYHSSITEVIRPMEMAELVDILPTLTLIEEETPTGPPSPTVMDMLESFGLGIGESNTVFNLNSGAEFESQSNSSSVTLTENTELQGQHTPGDHRPIFTLGCPPEDTDSVQLPNKTSFPARSQVEWERPSNSSS